MQACSLKAPEAASRAVDVGGGGGSGGATEYIYPKFPAFLKTDGDGGPGRSTQDTVSH